MAKKKIKAVLTALGESITDVVKDPANADIFDDGMFTDSPAIVAAKAMEGMANAIDKMVDIMTKFKDLKEKYKYVFLFTSSICFRRASPPAFPARGRRSQRAS